MKGSEFKALRESLGLSQSEMAVLLGYSGKTAISNLEAKLKHPSFLSCVVVRLLTGLSARRSKELKELLLFYGQEEMRSRKRLSQ